RRVAARHRDAAGAAQVHAVAAAVGAEQLGYPVGPGPGEGGVVVGGPVRLVVEAEVRAAVDDRHVSGQLLGEGGRVPVRQGEEDDVVAGEGRGVGGLEDPVGQGLQVR